MIIPTLPQNAPEWQAIADLVNSQSFWMPSVKLQRSLWAMAAVLISTALLYLTSCVLVLRRDPTRKWIVRKDSEGFWCPNIHVTIPALIFIYASANFASTVLFQSDIGSMVRPATFALMETSFIVLYLVAWTDTWATLYAVPPSPFRFNSTNFASAATSRPLRFNAFILGGYLLVVPAVPLAIYFCITLSQLNAHYFEFAIVVDTIVDAYGVDDIASVQRFTLPAFKAAFALKASSEKLYKILRVTSGYFAIATIYNWVTFVFASWQILRALIRQVSVVRSMLRNHRDLYQSQKNSELSLKDSTRGDVDSESQNKAQSVDYGSTASRKGWRRFFPSFRVDRVDQTVWSNLRMQHVVEAEEHGPVTGNRVRELKKQFEQLKLYTVNTAWRVTVSSLIQLSFLAMGLTISTNALDVPNKHSLRDISQLFCQWFGWTFGGGPGLILGIIAVIVAATAPSAPSPNPNPESDPDPDSDSEYEVPQGSTHRAISLHHLRSPNHNPSGTVDLPVAWTTPVVLHDDTRSRDSVRLSSTGEKWGSGSMREDGDVAVLRALRVGSSDGERGCLGSNESGEVGRPL